MKLGMPQLYEYDDIEDNFKLAKKLNLDFIEMNLNFESTRLSIINNQLEKLVNKYNIPISLHFFDECDFALYDEVVDAYISLLEKYVNKSNGICFSINVHLNPGPIVTVSGNKNYLYEKEYDTFIVRLINNLERVRKICDKSSMHFTLENTSELPYFYKRVYEKLKENNFEFCYDIGHDYTGNNMIRGIINNNDIKFKEFHFHNATNNKCHLALESGTMDLKYYKSLVSVDSNVVLEVKESNDLIKSVEKYNRI